MPPTRALGWTMMAWPACGTCMVAAVLAAATLAVAIFMAVRWHTASSRAWFAVREDANGRALLELADAIEAHADDLERMGRSARSQRTWARLCRRIAVEHLACINFLLLEPGTGPIGAAREDDDAPR